MEKIKIATWNISCGIPAEWNISNGIKKEKDYKKFGLLDEVIWKINDNNIDIIGLQESISFRNNDKSFAQIISENTNLKYFSEFEVSDCHLLENANIEEVLLSRYPIMKNERIMFKNVNLSNKSKDGKIYKLFDDGFIKSIIQINDNTSINFITGHAPAFHVFGRKPEEFKDVYKILEDNAKICINSNNTTFIVGDYNTEHLLDMLPFIKQIFSNNINGITYFEGTAIDYILSEKNIKCISHEKFENLSDHLLCIAEFQIWKQKTME